MTRPTSRETCRPLSPPHRCTSRLIAMCVGAAAAFGVVANRADLAAAAEPSRVQSDVTATDAQNERRAARDQAATSPTAADASVATTLPATADRFQNPFEGTHGIGSPETLFPEIRVDPAIAGALPRTVWNAIVAPGRPPVQMPRMIVDGNVWTQASQDAFERAGRRGNPSTLVPDERRVRNLAIRAQQQNAALCLDVEYYMINPYYGTDAQIEHGVREIAKMVGWVRDQSPATRLFFYSGAPLSDFYYPSFAFETATTRPMKEDRSYYDWLQGSRAEFRDKLDLWQRHNARMRQGPGRPVGLADLFDGVCPSLYLGRTHKPMRTTAIQGLVRGHVAEGRKYGKPVYPFVWPRWYETKDPVDLGNWVTQLREITRFADGVVLWSDNTPWDFPITFRVRIANELAKRRGQMTNRELYDALAPDFPGYTELEELLTLTNEQEERLFR